MTLRSFYFFQVKTALKLKFRSWKQAQNIRFLHSLARRRLISRSSFNNNLSGTRSSNISDLVMMPMLKYNHKNSNDMENDIGKYQESLENGNVCT